MMPFSPVSRLGHLEDWHEQDTEPADPQEGAVWLDTSDDPPVWKVHLDATWVVVGSDGGGGASYSEVVSGAGPFTIEHDLGTVAPHVALWLDGALVLADVTVLGPDQIEVDVAPSTVAGLTVAVTSVDAEPEDLGEVEFAWIGGVE